MHALLLVAHGSRRHQSNQEVVELAERLKSSSTEDYAIVHAAFLELAEPLIPDGIQKCIEDGATTVVVLPYFLNSGRHVTEDIPRIVHETQSRFPDINLQIAQHLGASDQMINLLMSSANQAKTGR